MAQGKKYIKRGHFKMFNCHENPTMPPPRGAAPVALLDEISDEESYAISFLRHWSSDEKSKTKVIAELVKHLGKHRAPDAEQCLDTLHFFLTTHPITPIIYHDLTCDCVGAHEACFANFITLAANAKKKDALIFASLLVNPRFLEVFHQSGEKFGLAIKLISQSEKVSKTHHTSETAGAR